MAEDTRRFLRYLDDERTAARTYRALADLTDGDRREALRELAGIEDRHAAHWEALLRERGVAVPPVEDAQPPEQLLSRARALGLDAVLAELEQGERDAQGVYDDEEFAAPGMADDERVHERTLRGLREAGAPPEGGAGVASSAAAGPGGTPSPAAGPGGTPSPAARSAAPIDAEQLRAAMSKAEPWHRADKSGTLRAAIFGASDGLVSNAALIMGFAGSGVANSTVAFAGVAGLLAGAFSMAAGEYVSVAGQRDVFNREIRLEAEELRDHPEEEARELELLYRAKGMDAALARAAAEKVLADPRMALDTLVREELGLDPDDLGSPLRVALSSFAAFAVGAVVPLLPFVLVSGSAATILSILFTAAALLGVGALVGRLSGAGVVRSALRQFLVGAAAAGVTYAIGRMIGGSVGLG